MNNFYCKYALGSFFLVLLPLLFSQTAIAQSVGVNTDTPEPDAALDVRSSATQSQGLLLPRLTTTERDAISSPTESLLIFNTDTKCFQSYISGVWVDIGCGTPPCTPPTIAFSPAAPNEICTPTSAPNIESRTYSLAPVPNATAYSWTVPTGWTITSGAGTGTIDVDINHTSTVGLNTIAVDVTVDDPACSGPVVYSLSHNFTQTKLPESITPATTSITNCLPSTINMSAGPMVFPNTTYTWSNNFLGSDLVGSAGGADNLYTVNVAPPLTTSPREVSLEATNVCGTANLVSTIEESAFLTFTSFAISPAFAISGGDPYVCNSGGSSPLNVTVNSPAVVPGSVSWSVLVAPSGVTMTTFGDAALIAANTSLVSGCSSSGLPTLPSTIRLRAEYTNASTGCVESGNFRAFVCCGGFGGITVSACVCY